MLVLVNVELPVAIKISGEVDGSELYSGLRHLLGPAHAGTFHAIFNQVLAGCLRPGHWQLANRWRGIRYSAFGSGCDKGSWQPR